MTARTAVCLALLLTINLALTPKVSAGSGSRGGAAASVGSGHRSGPALASYLWRYEGDLTRGELNGETEATIAGAFRLEDDTIFTVPEADDSGSAGRSARRSPNGNVFRNVSTSNEEKPREIGSYRVSRSGALTLIFADDAEAGLNGAMVLRRQRGSEGAWRGTFREKENKKTVRQWKMTVQAESE